MAYNWSAMLLYFCPLSTYQSEVAILERLMKREYDNHENARQNCLCRTGVV
ncbi:hypothetical protein THOG05_270015 [Vibrio rotiferianus]|nr:hypothetical protein THOG05_270015 [Vibrio rotiferianus]CAH1584739.1 hypothetical protein THOG10_370015 [Vibrio rotiferianus]CAH1586826.1 hypothetical protein THOB06_370015 [Vibrio rotiferianus]